MAQLYTVNNKFKNNAFTKEIIWHKGTFCYKLELLITPCIILNLNLVLTKTKRTKQDYIYISQIICR